ncbi:MAG: bifunctional glutamate N-acetyltransferase/amino-acid acetyltransferase ArgJ [Alphaproteobacteria bacterium]|nr:bifunctional glutamate N-acetyltransferase/amino-acid acetyltransferase ArgJ [Alphaproteobacteria bacterium]
MNKVSPLAPAKFPRLAPLAGVTLGSAACGLRYRGRTDLLFVELAPGTTVAGTFTRSLTSSAPVDWCRAALAKGRARAIVVNSGNANAFTGRAGDATVARTVAAVAGLLGCAREEVFVASTGVIGEPLPDDKITAALPALRARLVADGWEAAAAAIMTTDTFAKGATRTASIGGTKVTINGIAKGSGMIAPDLATMLAFVFTDAAIPAALLQKLCAQASQRSFNAITVDGDTSTSDTVILAATGQARHAPVPADGGGILGDFKRKLNQVMIDLAQQVVKDGEGASKFIEITVSGAASQRAARAIGLAIANSPLVKTAIAGEDANWGRIVMAVGKSGQKADRDRLAISIGGVQVTENGMVRPGYDEAPVVAHVKGRTVVIAVDVGVGRGKATVWTCDLTHGYIDINGSYRS